ncbi:sulfotransferase family protein [Novosphingobium sediminicola]|uniref:Sulfotransferase n=1 Tax=Novosphingobium sediminicola TaxID=563162 RepID=A0A7W6CK40_9SPHN|nr:sulfotransferase [Novosphingobium sediminicola]MBB3956925.1 hypothetical protein [Novosphingobium sediminicola]
MSRIDLFIAGGQKCGTTSLHAYLAEHPGFCAGPKELHFFDDEGVDWARHDYAAYEARFDGPGMRVDATPIYGFWPGALERIARYNPAARLIFLRRDPVERAWSQWCMEYARGDEAMPFARAIREERSRIATGETGMRHHSYVERGAYGMQAARAMALFPRRQLLFIESAELARDHAGVLARVAAFVGVGPFGAVSPLRRNARADVDYPASPDAADRAYIMERLSHDRVLFERLTGIGGARAV